LEYFIYKQDKDDLREYSEKLILESKKYRGRIPKKKRIRNKIYKRNEQERLRKFYPDEIHYMNDEKWIKDLYKL